MLLGLRSEDKGYALYLTDDPQGQYRDIAGYLKPDGFRGYGLPPKKRRKDARGPKRFGGRNKIFMPVHAH